MPSDPYDVAVLGGGAAGLTAAREARRRGARTVLIESARIGGDCTFTGCIPSKTLLQAAAAGCDWATAQARVRSAIDTVSASEDVHTLRGEGIDVVQGTAEVVEPGCISVDGTLVRSIHTIIATGASPAVPPVPGLDTVAFDTSDTFFDARSQPRSLAILGGGSIGCELAQAMARLGVPVTLVEGTGRVLGREERSASTVVVEALRADGVEVITDADVTRVRTDEAGLALLLRDRPTVRVERLLVATGRHPTGRGLGLEQIGVHIDATGAVVTDDTMATTVPGVWAVGDVTGRSQLTHAGARMAVVAVHNALGRHRRLRTQRYNADLVPWATFTDPEVGRIGLTEDQAAQVGPARVAELPFSELDRAITADRTEGFVKLIAGPRRGLGWAGGGRLLGATIVGPTAGDLVNEIALAMTTSAFTGRLAQTVHVYPSWSMAIQLAAAQFFFEQGGRRARPARTQPVSS